MNNSLYIYIYNTYMLTSKCSFTTFIFLPSSLCSHMLLSIVRNYFLYHQVWLSELLWKWCFYANMQYIGNVRDCLCVYVFACVIKTLTYVTGVVLRLMSRFIVICFFGIIMALLVGITMNFMLICLWGVLSHVCHKHVP